MSFSDKINALCARRRFGMRQGLERMLAMMEFMGHPERELVAVHVAGTNGKGSVTAIVAAVLQHAGFGPIGRYTSPHLVYFNERICINGVPVSDETLERALGAVEAAVTKVENETDAGSPTFFECITALAFEVFRNEGVRIAVIETGLGGRLDATNVILPLVSVITCIGLEHCEYLGDTIEAIAGEKAGIVKPSRPVVLGGALDVSAREVICNVASKLKSPIVDSSVSVHAKMLDGSGVVSFCDSYRSVSGIGYQLAGAYQMENLTTAINAIEAFSASSGLPVSDDAFKLGLSEVVWPCRFQTVSVNPTVIVDGAHNPNATLALRDALKKLHTERPMTLVTGFCDDKDSIAALKHLNALFKSAFAVTIPSPRSLSAGEMAVKLRSAGFRDVTPIADWREGLDAAIARAREQNGIVVVCGSLFLAGAVADRFGALPWTSGVRTGNEMLKR